MRRSRIISPGLREVKKRLRIKKLRKELKKLEKEAIKKNPSPPKMASHARLSSGFANLSAVARRAKAEDSQNKKPVKKSRTAKIKKPAKKKLTAKWAQQRARLSPPKTE